jgi:nucleoid DNA-binding protein
MPKGSITARRKIMGKKPGNSKPLTKAEYITEISERCTEVPKSVVAAVLQAQSEIAVEQLTKKGPGVVSIPGVVRLKTVDKPAKPARPGRNPFTGESITIKAKPASRAVRAAPVKALKEAVQ